MTIEDYVLEQQQKLAKFSLWWYNQSKENPKDFPLDLDPSEWNEQFILWEGGDI